MLKLIPTIYFYLVSLIGLVLLIIGIFAGIHFIVGISVYSKYPLPNGTEQRCNYITAPEPMQTAPIKQQTSIAQQKQDCLQELEQERIQTKKQDLEKALSFTLIGLLLFGIHFYFARKQK